MYPGTSCLGSLFQHISLNNISVNHQEAIALFLGLQEEYFLNNCKVQFLKVLIHIENYQDMDAQILGENSIRIWDLLSNQYWLKVVFHEDTCLGFQK